MNRKWIYLLLVPLAIYIFCLWKFNYYDIAILDKSGYETENSIVLRVPKYAVNKYPGWSHSRYGAVSLDVWYPSLVDKVSINYWISSSSDIKASKEKPTKNDQELSIRVGSDQMTPQKNTLDFANRPVWCDLRPMAGHPFVDEGIVGNFQKYVSYAFVTTSKNPEAVLKPYYIKYLPNKPLEGVYCLSCISKANCQMFGVTDLGIPYSAFYEEEKMPNEAIEIHKAVERYLSSKVIG